MLDDLFDPDRSGRAWVTYALIAAMLVASLPALPWPEVRGVLGGIGPLRYPWQVWTSAFMHGWPGVPLLVHLVLNLILIGFVGVAAEKLLGAARYLGITGLALVAYWAVRRITGIEANGASVFLWAYAPVLFVGLRAAARSGRPVGDAYQKAKGFLVIMWLLVPIAMVGILVVHGVRPWIAVLLGNVFHLSATAAGVAAAVGWRGRIRDRLRTGRYAVAPADRLGAGASAALPLLLMLLVALTLAGVLTG